MPNDAGSVFFSIVHQILVVEKRYSVREIAASLGMSYAAFYARISGRGSFTPEELRRLLQLVPDQRLVDWLLAKSAFMPVARVGKSHPDLSISALEHATQTAERALSIVKDLSTAAVEETVDGECWKRIDGQISEMERSVATLRAVLPYLSANPTELTKRLAAI